MPTPPPDAAHFVEGIRLGFLAMDENLRVMPEFSNGSEKSGSTAVCAFISPKYIFLANCGDSRGILSTAEGKVALKVTHLKRETDLSLTPQLLNLCSPSITSQLLPAKRSAFKKLEVAS